MLHATKGRFNWGQVVGVDVTGAGLELAATRWARAKS